MRLAGDRETRARRLHSLTGVVPLGIFLILHLAINARAMQGREALDRTLALVLGIPLYPLLELGLVGLPLAFHSGYGVYRSYQIARGRLAPASARSPSRALLERATGLLALVFIAFHLYDLRGRVLSGYLIEADVYPKLAAQLSSTTSWGIPLFALFYIAGVTATVFHFASGLHGFSVAWGFARSERATRNAGWVCGVLGVVLFLLGTSTVVYYATGSRFFFR